jgi:3,4-dihydroxy 2-butanone 4-phosphate synthase/GTP cyclohydrolase II
VLVRTGQTEGSLDLCRLAGLYPGAAIIEIMRDDGEMARLPDLQKLSAKHGIKLCSVAQIIEHRLARESLIRRLDPIGGVPITTAMGEFNLIAYESLVDSLPHLALTVGGVGRLDASGKVIEVHEPTLVRVHRRHLLGDLFGDLNSCREGATGDTLRGSLKAIQAAGRGVVLYLRPEGLADEGGLDERLHTVRRGGADRGADSPDLTHPQGFAAGMTPQRGREVGIGSQILRNLGLRKLRLLTNHTTEWPGLEAFGLEIVERVAVRPAS